jgi:DNA polymerase-3 subunit epsilon
VLSTHLLSFYRQASQQLFTVVDVETTGSKPPAARVIEVSVLQATLTEGILQQETFLINPQVCVPTQITSFTGITQAMVDRAESPEVVWQQCYSQLNQGVLTAHNLEFDYGFIQSEYALLDTVFERPVEAQLCTVVLSRLMLPDLPSRSLPNLVHHFGFDVGRSHRAEADTKACWLLLHRLLTEILNEPDEVLLPRFAQQWIPLKDAATILGCTGRQARSRLTHANVQPRLVGRYKTPMYQRGAVEQVYWQKSEQLSWLPN